nr:nucleotidyl transferase AbiEii/AbiGii toxin family protein [Rhodococcus sp. HNM0563]
MDERDAVAVRFGVSPEQVARDHLVSHLLAALSAPFADRLHFIGGTALARTHLVNGRLSEDIDLVALGNRTTLATDIDSVLPRAVSRTHGRLSWEPALSEVRDTEPAFLRTDGGLSVKVQLLSSKDRTVWPAELRSIEQRYGDAAHAQLWVPTLPAFVASKTTTWHHRRASRDLWDLWSLAALGAIDGDAAVLYARHGPTNRLPTRELFATPPDEADWTAQLAGQTRLDVTARAATAIVRESWARVTQLDTMQEDGER